MKETECTSSVVESTRDKFLAVLRETSLKMVRLMRDASERDASGVATLYAPVTCAQHSAVRFGSRRHCSRINTFMSTHYRFTPR